MRAFEFITEYTQYPLTPYGEQVDAFMDPSYRELKGMLNKNDVRGRTYRDVDSNKRHIMIWNANKANHGDLDEELQKYGFVFDYIAGDFDLYITKRKDDSPIIQGFSSEWDAWLTPSEINDNILWGVGAGSTKPDEAKQRAISDPKVKRMMGFK